MTPTKYIPSYDSLAELEATSKQRLVKTGSIANVVGVLYEKTDTGWEKLSLSPVIAGCRVSNAQAKSHDKNITGITKNGTNDYTVVVSVNTATKYLPVVTPGSDGANSLKVVEIDSTHFQVTNASTPPGSDAGFIFMLLSMD